MNPLDFTLGKIINNTRYRKKTGEDSEDVAIKSNTLSKELALKMGGDIGVEGKTRKEGGK